MAFNRCIKNLLKLIAMLQDNSVNNHVLENRCTKPFLGPNATCICYNTRVINLYNKTYLFYFTFYISNCQVLSYFIHKRINFHYLFFQPL